MKWGAGRHDLESWLLGAACLGLVVASSVLALNAVVTYPTALFAGAVGTFALLPPERGRFPRHYALLAILGVVSVLATLVLHQMGR